MYRYLLPTIVGMNYTDITVTSLDGNKRIPKWRNFLAISPHHSVGFLFSDLYLPALPGPPPPPPRPPFTHNLCHTSSTHTHTHTHHTPSSHTITHPCHCHTHLFHTPSSKHHLCHTISHISSTHHLDARVPPSFLRFAWRAWPVTRGTFAWHWARSTCVLRGRHGTYRY